MDVLLTVVELDSFVAAAEQVFTTAEREALIWFLANHPEEGDLVQGTGGVRKLRWGARGHGKRGGARVIYYFASAVIP
jgi:hypothetical protein